LATKQLFVRKELVQLYITGLLLTRIVSKVVWYY